MCTRTELTRQYFYKNIDMVNILSQKVALCNYTKFKCYINLTPLTFEFHNFSFMFNNSQNVISFVVHKDFVNISEIFFQINNINISFSIILLEKW